MQRDVDIHIAIATFNARSYIGACLQSIRDFIDVDLSVTVTLVDNGSHDRTAEYVRQAFPEVDVVARSDNAGFAVATNQAIQRGHAKYYLILNPDTQLMAGCISGVMRVLADNPSAAVVGCQLLLLDGTFDHACKRELPTPASSIAYYLSKMGLRVKSSYCVPDLNRDDTGEVGAVNGAFMLVRRSALDDVGLFDERYWMYAEDLDWCRRCQERGWKVIYHGVSRAVHLKGAASGTRRNLKVNWHFHHSMALYHQKFDAEGHALSTLFIYAAIYCKFVVSAVRSALFRWRSDMLQRSTS